MCYVIKIVNNVKLLTIKYGRGQCLELYSLIVHWVISPWLMQKISYWCRRYYCLMLRSSVAMMSLEKSRYIGCWLYRGLVVYLSSMFETWYTARLKRSICLVFAVFDLDGYMMCCVNEIWKYIAYVVFCSCNLEPAQRRLSNLRVLCGWALLTYANVKRL